MNSEPTFTTETVKKLVLDKKEIMRKKTEALTDKIIEYVNSVYAGEIQKALDKNISCSEVRIRLPKALRKALARLSDDEWHVARDKVNKSLTKNGFEVELKTNSYACDDCLWRYMACTKYYNVVVKWSRYRY